jgi:DNA-binding LytR/AlgR family response regulator
MLNIALCSDSRRELDQLEALMDDYRSLRPNIDFSVHRFSSVQELEDRVQSGIRFPLCLVDLHIAWSGDRTSPSEAVRQMEPDTLILTLSTVVELGRTDTSRPFACLSKPISGGELFPILDRAFAKLQVLFSHILTVQTSKGPQDLPFHRISFARYHDHRICYHMSNGEDILTSTLRLPFKILSAPLIQEGSFIRISAACAANLQYMDSIRGRELVMQDGSSVSIPRENLSQVRRALKEFQLRQQPPG